MDYDPLVETMLVERSMDRIDQVEMGKEIQRLKEENADLRRQLGYKKINSQFNNYDDLIQENIKLKRKLGYFEDEIENDIKNHSPYRKSNAVWWAYIIFSLALLLGSVIFFLIITSRIIM